MLVNLPALDPPLTLELEPGIRLESESGFATGGYKTATGYGYFTATGNESIAGGTTRSPMGYVWDYSSSN